MYYPKENHDELLSRIEQVVAKIRQEADVLIDVDVGSLFLRARAILDALTPYFGRQRQGIEVIYLIIFVQKTSSSRNVVSMEGMHVSLENERTFLYTIPNKKGKVV